MKIESHQLEINGVNIAFQAVGRGPAVVCLHATGHDSGDFLPFFDKVKDQYRILALDWPEHGRSGPDDRPVSASRYANLAEKLLDGVKIKNAIVIGNSIGGAAAISLAAARPDQVKALVLSSPGGLEPPTAFARIAVKMMIRFFKAGEARRFWFGRAFSIYYRMVLPAAPFRRAEITANWPQTISVIRSAWESFILPDFDNRERIKRVACPIWFAWAKQDNIVAYRRSKKTIELLPNATVSLFKGGHSPFLEDPDAFTRGFLAFANNL